MESKTRAMRGMMFNGKSFGMSSHGRLNLKLTPERVDQLIGDGAGVRFSASEGKPAKGWIEVTLPESKWVDLAQEANNLAVTGAPKSK